VQRGVEGSFLDEEITLGAFLDPTQNLEPVHATAAAERSEAEELDGSREDR
jgi:hypothetical protein